METIYIYSLHTYFQFSFDGVADSMMVDTIPGSSGPGLKPVPHLLVNSSKLLNVSKRCMSSSPRQK